MADPTMEDKEKKQQDKKNNKQVHSCEAVETPFDLWIPQIGFYLPVQDPAQIQPGRSHANLNLFFQMYTIQ